MGLFLAMSGVVGAEKTAVEAALQAFVGERNGSFRPMARTTDEENTLVLCQDNLTCSVLYPWEFFEWDEASRWLSSHLNAPVFSFHIHDEDLWMFVLFDKGEQVAQFNPLPEYWDDGISQEERALWAGDAEEIASYITGLDPDSIRPYFKHWDFDEENPGKAFPSDQFGFRDCWQLCDFMRKIGLKYPLDETGKILGETYEFIVA